MGDAINVRAPRPCVSKCWSWFRFNADHYSLEPYCKRFNAILVLDDIASQFNIFINNVEIFPLISSDIFKKDYSILWSIFECMKRNYIWLKKFIQNIGGDNWKTQQQKKRQVLADGGCQGRKGREWKQPCADVFRNGWYLKLRNIYRKKPVLECLFNKVASLKAWELFSNLVLVLLKFFIN